MAAPKLRFKEFKNDWVKTNLGEVVKFSNGKRVPLSESERQKRQGSYRYYGASGVIDYLDDYLFDGEYILIGEDGANIITRSSTLAFVVTGKFWVNNHAHIFQSKEGNNIFLAAYLESLNFEKFNSGTAQPKLNLENLKKVPVANPTKEEQTKIATFLSAVDEKINQLTQKHQLLSQYKQGMMQKLFSQKMRFKAEDGSEFGEWECIQANSIFENYSNKNHDGSLTILAATQDKGVVPRDEIDIDIKSSDASVLSYKIIEKGNFVISLRSFQGGIEYSNYEGICSPAYTVLKVIKPIDTGFYKAYLKTNDFIQRLSSTVIGIRDGKQISYQAFSTLMIDYPCLEEQTKIANFLSSIDQKIEVVTQQIEQVKQWKKGLLQQMFV